MVEDHERAKEHRGSEHEAREARLLETDRRRMVREHERDEHARGAWRREADDVLAGLRGAPTLVHREDVEAREAHDRARREKEAHELPDEAELMQRPKVHEHARRDAEGERVRERVELETEGALLRGGHLRVRAPRPQRKGTFARARPSRACIRFATACTSAVVGGPSA